MVRHEIRFARKSLTDAKVKQSLLVAFDISASKCHETLVTIVVFDTHRSQLLSSQTSLGLEQCVKITQITVVALLPASQ